MRIHILLVSIALLGSAVESSAQAPAETPSRVETLIQAAQALPDVRADDARTAAVAAALVETHDVPAELLLAIAWGESRFITTTVTWRACGLVQVIAPSHEACAFLEIPIVGMYVGRRQLQEWLRIARGDLHLALLGNACGVSALRGVCSKTVWPAWVLARAARLRRLEDEPRS